MVFPNFDSGTYMSSFTINSKFFQMISKDTDKEMWDELSILIGNCAEYVLEKYDKIRIGSSICMNCDYYLMGVCNNKNSKYYKTKREFGDECNDGFEDFY